jgi:predicted transcriptional regulator
MSKRPDGALEHDIMTVLWASDEPLLPAEIKAALAIELAYTSVATVLGRLVGKGLVERVEAGRAFAYSATVSESELATRRIATVMAATSNRAEVLAGFVETLSPGDVAALRELLGSTPG